MGIDQSSIYFLILSLIMLNGYYSYSSRDIPLCKTTHILTTQDSQPFNPTLICTECIKLKVLSSDFLQCIDVRHEIGMINLGNCKRLGEDGQCAEANYAIELYQNSYSYIESVKFDERCAEVDEEYNKCIFPRFGYILDIATNLLHQDSFYFHSYCALFNSSTQKCLKYFPGFLPHPNGGLGRFLKDFINKEKVDQTLSNSQSIVCLSDYMFVGTIEEPIGCIPRTKRIIQEQEIENCEVHEYDKVLCKKCKDGFAINKNRQFCRNINVPKCVEYSTIQGEPICSKCENLYRYLNGRCEEMTNCLEVSPYNSNFCLTCSKNHILQFDNNKCVLNNQIIYSEVENCEEYSGNSNCVLCKDNNNFYLSDKKCLPRVNSLYCKQPNPLSDYCLTLECECESEFLQLDKQSNEFDLSLPQLFDILKYEQTNRNSKISFEIMCAKRQHYPLEGCQKYHPFIDSCLECESNYFMIKRQIEQPSLKRADHYGTYQYDCTLDDPNYEKQQINNCKVYSPDYLSCIQCEEGYYEIDLGCKKGIESCLIHYDSNSCAQCADGYLDFGYLQKQNEKILNQCRKNENLVGLILHQSVDSSTMQTQIEFSYDYCMQYDESGNCTECTNGFMLTQENKCVNDSLLPLCKKGIIREESLLQCTQCTYLISLVKDKCQTPKQYSCTDKQCSQKCNSLFKLRRDKQQTNNNQQNNKNRNGQKPNTSSKDNKYQGKGGFNNNSNNENNQIQIQDKIESKDICIVNIDTNFYISEQPKYHKQFMGQLEIKECRHENCSRCDLDGCYKCDKGYGLEWNTKRCKILCSENGDLNKQCIEPTSYDTQESHYELSESIPYKEYNNTVLIKNQENQFEKQQQITPDQDVGIYFKVTIGCLIILILVLLIVRFYRRRQLKNLGSSNLSYQVNSFIYYQQDQSSIQDQKYLETI